jgi:hypothetical protein
VNNIFEPHNCTAILLNSCKEFLKSAKINCLSTQHKTLIWVLRLLSVPSIRGWNMSYRLFSVFASSETGLTNGSFTPYRPRWSYNNLSYYTHNTVIHLQVYNARLNPETLYTQHVVDSYYPRVEVTIPHVYSDASQDCHWTNIPFGQYHTSSQTQKELFYVILNSFAVKCGPEAQPNADGIYTRNMMTVWKSGYVG